MQLWKAGQPFITLTAIALDLEDRLHTSRSYGFLMGHLQNIGGVASQYQAKAVGFWGVETQAAGSRLIQPRISRRTCSVSHIKFKGVLRRFRPCN